MCYHILMIGALLGDIIGAPYEYSPCKDKNFELFPKKTRGMTDDSYMTIAVFSALKKCRGDYTDLEKVAAEELAKWGNRYPNADYGNNFSKWLAENKNE